MRALDPKTLRRLAEIIVDIDGAYERSGRRLAELMRDARWDDPPEYDGSPRVPWLVEVLEERDPGDVERLICRVCAPVEYEDGVAGAEPMRGAVNEVLALEQLTVGEVKGRPVLTELRVADGAPIYSAPDDLRPRLSRLLHDEATIDFLVGRADEAAMSERAGAYSLTLIGIGSFLEGLLFAALYEHDGAFRTHGLPGRKGAWIPAERVSLAQLIDTTHSAGWIHLDAMDFAHHVRDYRNFVHLRNQMERGFTPDADTVMLCWAPIRAVLNDLDTALAGSGGGV